MWQVQVPVLRSQFRPFRLFHWAMQICSHPYLFPNARMWGWAGMLCCSSGRGWYARRFPEDLSPVHGGYFPDGRCYERGIRLPSQGARVDGRPLTLERPIRTVQAVAPRYPVSGASIAEISSDQSVSRGGMHPICRDHLSSAVDSPCSPPLSPSVCE